MKVAIDISPTRTGHAVRGIGAYTKNLIDQYKSRSWKCQFIYFDNPLSPPPADIIHYPYFDLFTRSLPQRNPNVRVVTIHDVIPLVFPNYFPVGIRGYINLFFQKRSVKNIQAVICDSASSKTDIASKLSYPKERIHVVYLAAGSKFKKIENQEFLASTIKKYNLPKTFVLYVGDVNWNKNIPNLLEAIKIFKVNLVMVGHALVDKNLVQTKEIDKLIKKLNLQDKITRTGYVNEDDLIAIYNLAKVTVMPSFYEGFGLPLMESMACGTPVVCSKVASLTEISGPAILCDPTSPKEIAQKISHLINLPQNKRQILSQKCINHASKFTWEKVARQTISIYESLL